MGTTETPADDGSGRVRSEPLRGEAQALSEDPLMLGNPPKPAMIDAQMHEESPHLIKEGEEELHTTQVTPLALKSIDEIMMEQWASPMAQSSTDESFLDSIASSLQYFTAACSLSTSTPESS